MIGPARYQQTRATERNGMEFQELLDQLVVPRPNGSEGLRKTASFIYSTLQAHTSELDLQTFSATPYGSQLLIAFTFVLALAFAILMLRGRYGLALLLSVGSWAFFIAEGELLWSPVSGLLAQSEQNIVATFPGRADGPTLVFAAHYDTATQFGDHYLWARWGVALGLGQCLGLILPIAGLWQQRKRQRDLPRAVVIGATALLVIPAAALTLFIAVGPVLAKPSPGALDNGGSVAVLLRLAEDMAARPPDSRTTVKLVFLASEEEGGIGSWRFARDLAADGSVHVINLDNIGGSNQLGFGTDEGFLFRHYPPSALLVRTIDDTARELGNEPLVPVSYPLMTMTDARSFLAQGIPAVTIQSAINGQWPHHLHSARDSRDRVSIAALEATLELLNAVVARVERDPLLAQLEATD